MEYRYFIAYRYYSLTETGNGRVEVSRCLPIRGMGDIEDIEKVIQESKYNEAVKIIVQNWQRFEKGE